MDKDPILKTPTTKEEDDYFKKNKQVFIGKCGVAFLVIGFIVATAIPSIYSWDGAGDTWTCQKCGASNYTWQMSCTKC